MCFLFVFIYFITKGNPPLADCPINETETFSVKKRLSFTQKSELFVKDSEIDKQISEHRDITALKNEYIFCLLGAAKNLITN